MNKFAEIKEYLDKNFSKTKGFEFHYNSGVDFYSKQEYDKAIKSFKNASEQQNIKPQVYYNLALSHQQVKEYDKAIIAYHKFLALNPKDYDGLYNLALVYYLKQNYEKAVEYFKECTELKKDETGVKALTLAYLSDDKMQEAIDFANEIFNLPEIGLKLYFHIARTFENKNSLNKDFTFIDKAMEMYFKILEKDTKNFEAYLAVSICCAKKGEWETSVEFCKKAIEVNPKSYEANNQMGLVYYCCNEVKEAINYYEKALKLKPEGDYKIYSNLGYAYEKIGEIDKAVKIFNQLVKKFPQVPAKDEIKNHLRVLKTL